MIEKLVEIEFLVQCYGYKKGERQKFSSSYAECLIADKRAKAVDFPMKDKMVRQVSNKGIGG